jgi:CRP-like cAMP-binding protein
MADSIGASREMVSRVMRDLQADGFVEVRGNSTYLRDNIAAID